MGDIGDLYREMRDDRRDRRRRLGKACPQCNLSQPKRIPTTLLPGQRCKVCGYIDPRKREE